VASFALPWVVVMATVPVPVLVKSATFVLAVVLVKTTVSPLAAAEVQPAKIPV
jgi:cell envelope opacity-associated protein A